MRCKKRVTFFVTLLRGVGRDRTADTRIFSPLLYRLSYRTIRQTRRSPIPITYLIKGGKNRLSDPIFEINAPEIRKIFDPAASAGPSQKGLLTRASRHPYMPYSLRNLIRMIFSCSHVKLPSESSCCATCKLLVSQRLK